MAIVETGEACKHSRGDFFGGMWICAECFRPLDQRPVRYAPVPFGPEKRARQDVVWKAAIAFDADGTKFSTFLTWMVRHLRMKSLWSISKDEARRECLLVLIDQGEPYGSGNAYWTKADAKELVDECICSYWDEAPAGSN